MRSKLTLKEQRAFDRRFPGAKADIAAMKAHDEGRPSPRIHVTRLPYPPSPEEILRVRSAMHLSQSRMAHLLNTPLKTYQNWEQGTRVPMGAVSLLLRLLSKKPAMAKELLAV